MNTAYDAGLEWLIYISLFMLVLPGLVAYWMADRQDHQFEKKLERDIHPKPRVDLPHHSSQRPAA